MCSMYTNVDLCLVKKEADLLWVWTLGPLVLVWGIGFAVYYCRRWLIERKLNRIVLE